MPSKEHGAKEAVGKLRRAEVVLAQGAATAEACRRIAISVPDEGSGEGECAASRGNR